MPGETGDERPNSPTSSRACCAAPAANDFTAPARRGARDSSTPAGTARRSSSPAKGVGFARGSSLRGPALLVELEALKPADFARRIDLMSSSPLRDSTGAIESLDRSLERLDQLFLWGHWTGAEYQAERDRLEALRNELPAPEGQQPFDPKLTGLLDRRDPRDAVCRA